MAGWFSSSLLAYRHALCSVACALLWQHAQAGPWLQDGQPTALAQQAVQILQSANTEGLSPEAYDGPRLAQAFQTAQSAALSEVAAAAFEADLSAALQRYLTDLHQGRTSASGQAPLQPDSPARIDATDTLRAAVALEDLEAALHTARPTLAQYAQLRHALAHYRSLAQHPAWHRALPALPGRRLEPGQAWHGLAQLQQRLIALGDLPATTTPTAPTHYDAQLQAGVRAFQQRHGLQDDGLLGKATLAALAIAPAERVQQLELNLERLRWTPLRRAERSIVVNLPEFMLRAYVWQNNEITEQLSMKVIVGQAFNTRTPLLDEDLRLIEFSPYWNVPPSITQAELVPRLRRDPAYWQRQGFEFVQPNGKAQPTLSEQALNAVLHGQMRLRQRPGPKNALGDIKFVFPNQHHIYLHHTPNPQLFERARRDFSHGCIRVQDPVALAAFALQDRADWPPERIRSAMARGQASSVQVAPPLPVVLTYQTAIVKDGKVHFFADLYGHDQRLQQALQAGAKPPSAP